MNKSRVNLQLCGLTMLLAGLAACSAAGDAARFPALTAVDTAAFADDCLSIVKRNRVAALKVHKRNLDAVLKLDWRNDEISDDQRKSINALRDAEVIDIALTMQEAARTAKPGHFQTAFAENASGVDAIAKKSWAREEIGEASADLLLKLGVARGVDLATAFRTAAPTAPPGHFATAYTAHAKALGALAGADWKTHERNDDEEAALEAVSRAYDRDLAIALRNVRKVLPPGAFHAAYDSVAASVDSIADATRPQGKDDQSAFSLCGVMSVYRASQAPR